MLKIDYFRYVIEVARAGTINKAAERLFVSQPYLSLELKNLEHKLGVQLFLRSNKGIALTQAGEKFLEYAQSICQMVEQAEQISQLYTQTTEHLNISSMYSFTMLDLYNDFSSQNHAREYITYEEIPNQAIADKVYRGSSHIGLIYLCSEDVPHAKEVFSRLGLNFVPLVDEPVCAVLNHSNPLARQRSVRVEQLMGFDYLSKRPGAEQPPSAIPSVKYPQISNLRMTKPLYFDNNRSLLYYITKNPTCYTIGQKSLNLTNPFLVSGDLVYIPIEGLDDTLVTGYLVNENIPSSDLQERFIDALEHFFASYVQEME